MKKNGILNSELSTLLASLRHTDQILIGDAGLPIPRGVKQIDLSLELGIPSFLQVLELIEKEMAIESYVLASEMQTENMPIYQEVTELLSDQPETTVSHETFKELSANVKGIIRTGENTPYANIILQSACLF